MKKVIKLKIGSEKEREVVLESNTWTIKIDTPCTVSVTTDDEYLWEGPYKVLRGNVGEFTPTPQELPSLELEEVKVDDRITTDYRYGREFLIIRITPTGLIGKYIGYEYP